MNKPAPKEPSMDEILSSIRQIIADDDSASAPEPAPSPPPAAPSRPGGPPLPLSAAQIVPEPPAPQASPAQPARGAVETEEIAARAFARDLAEDAPPGPKAAMEDEDGPIGFAEAQLVEGDDVTFEADAEAIAETPEPDPIPEPAQARQAMAVGRAAPLPDPTLTADVAEQLLEPATEAAVRHTFSRLGAMSIGTPGVTVESMMREMLRPMLKEWLDEHLPAVVERMVEREIARISRGGD